VPENRQDQTYIQHELGLGKNGDSTRLVAFVLPLGDYSHVIDLTAGDLLRKRDKQREEAVHARTDALMAKAAKLAKRGETE